LQTVDTVEKQVLLVRGSPKKTLCRLRLVRAIATTHAMQLVKATKTRKRARVVSLAKSLIVEEN
jgi:hypothetical protein